MFTYIQRTGRLYRDGKYMTTGYSGYGKGMNDPAQQNVANVGPIPVDHYTIGRAFTHDKTGPFTMRLTPNDGTAGDTERAGFLIHGDNADHTASHGCIILARPYRQQIDAAVAAGEDQLEVVADEKEIA